MDILQRTLLQLECNIDDMNPEFFPYVMERIFDCGARDCWISPVIMKKGRPGNTLAVLCDPQFKDQIVEVILAETSSLGVRVTEVQRLELERRQEVVSTRFGEIPVKVAFKKTGEIFNALPEVSICAELAKRHGVSLKEVYQLALTSWESTKNDH